MHNGHKQYKFMRWHNWRGKRIRPLPLVLAGICIALIIAAICMLNGNKRLNEQARQNTQALLEAAQATSMPANTTRPTVLQDVDGYSIIATISINKLALKLPVIGKTTDEALKIAPCLYSGPATPADSGNIIITAHNNADGSQFGRLKELKKGDDIMLMDKWGDTFTYKIYDMETILPDAVAELEEYEGEKALTLLTCTSNGNKRLLLRCRMVGNAVGDQ